MITDGLMVVVQQCVREEVSQLRWRRATLPARSREPR